MPKRASLDLNQFKIELPKPKRDPLETIIPTAPPPSITNPSSRTSDQPAKQLSGQSVEGENDQRAKRPKRQATNRPKGQKTKRVIKRHGFDVYQDQVISLNKIQVELYMRKGKKPAIGELVRPAFDRLIAEKLKELGEA